MSAPAWKNPMRPDHEEVADALARLCMAEQVLRTLAAWLREQDCTPTEWQASETLDGALRLLDGTYTTLGYAQPPAEAAAA
jgi:hypothetical protein